MAPTQNVKVPIKSVALPNEHGGWGFTLEPILLGLLVAPTWAGLGLSLFAFGAFLTRHPLKLWLADWRRGKVFARTRVARGFALLYGGIGLLSLGLALWTAQGGFWWPLLAALPLIVVQLWFDAHNQGRNLLPEIAGAVAMGSVAAGIALAAGWEAKPALGLWLVLAMRSVGAIYYARAQVRRFRGEAVRLEPVYRAEVLVVLVLLLGVFGGWVPLGGLLAVALLIPLSLYTFAKPPVPAKVVGWTQMALGLLTVLGTALG